MAVKEQALLLVLLVVVSLETAACFSNGKVTQGCENMVPEHGHESSTDPAPYNITVDKAKYSAGDQIRVTLSVAPSGSSAYFKGFLVEAWDAGRPNGGAVGSFALVNPGISQLLTCGRTEGSAVSHTSEHKKTEVQVVWTPPANPPLNVQFLATVVHKFKVYWVRIPGPVVSLDGAMPAPPLPTGTAETTAAPAVLPSPFSSEACGSRKSCLREPVGCDPRGGPGCFFLSFRAEGESVVFELSGPARGYVAFALSLDKWMGNDDVYLCERDGDRVDIRAAYVSGRTHPEPAFQNALRDTAWRLSDGVIQCSFRRDIHVPLHNQSRFRLDQSYFLFIAHGGAENGLIHRHERQPLISTYMKVISGPPEELSGSRSPLIIKFHGVFMLIAWMTTVTTGVIIARYFKSDWPQTSVFGQRVWFQVHRGLMILTVLLTCLGFILPFIYREGWSTKAGSHPYLGCTVMALAVIQPIMAVFRPTSNSSRRYIFNRLHFGTGTIAQILAVVAIFLGIHQQALLLPGPWSTVVLGGCVIWGVLTDLVLELHRKGLFPKGKTDAEDKADILFGPSVECEGPSKEFGFKKMVLAVFLSGNLGFLTALLYTISKV